MQAFDRDTPLPDERLSLLFDLGTPSQKVTLDEMPCRCAGLQLQRRQQGGDRRLRRGRPADGESGHGRRRAPAWAAAPARRSSTDLVDWLCGGEAEEDPSVHYYVPRIPLAKPELIKAIREPRAKIGLERLRRTRGGARGRRQQTGPRLAC